jgi:pimeloyl-ACP methyl ester carboxylesterase
VITTARDGTRLHYLVAGEGPPLVLVGGKTSTVAGAWWRYIPVLASHLKVVAPDNRGAGESDKPDVPYTTSMLAADALAVLQAAGETSAHWFGISMGGMTLQQLALTHPTAVRSLIIAASHCGKAQTPSSVPAEGPLRRFANLYASSFLKEHPEWVLDDARQFGKMPLHAIHRQDQAVRNHDVCGRLGEIRQPVLILHGRQDRMVPVERAEELRRGLPNAELKILDPAGHQVHSEQFEVVLPLVLQFIERVESGRPR